MNRVAIVSAKRTAIGSFGGSLKDISAAKIGGELVKKALEDINLNPNLVDEISLWIRSEKCCSWGTINITR